MTDSDSSGGKVDVSHYGFQKTVYRGSDHTSYWGSFNSGTTGKILTVGQQLFAIIFWPSYVQIGIFRNNTSAEQVVTIRGPSYTYINGVSDKYFISAVTFGEDDVFNPPFLNFLEDGGLMRVDSFDEYLDYCQIRRMYELSSPVASTATVTEIRIPYSFLSWFFIDSARKIYNDDGSLKSDYKSQNFMFSDFEN